MRRFWPALAATMLMAAGCGGGGDPAGDPVATPPASVGPAVPVPSGEAVPSGVATREAGGQAEFVAVVRDRVPEAATGRRDSEIAGIARQACASLADGTEAGAVVAGTRSLGTLDAEAVDEATARELIKLAIDTVCPDQDRRVDEF